MVSLVARSISLIYGVSEGAWSVWGSRESGLRKADETIRRGYLAICQSVLEPHLSMNVLLTCRFMVLAPFLPNRKPVHSRGQQDNGGRTPRPPQPFSRLSFSRREVSSDAPVPTVAAYMPTRRRSRVSASEGQRWVHVAWDRRIDHQCPQASYTRRPHSIALQCTGSHVLKLNGVQ